MNADDFLPSDLLQIEFTKICSVLIKTKRNMIRCNDGNRFGTYIDLKKLYAPSNYCA